MFYLLFGNKTARLPRAHISQPSSSALSIRLRKTDIWSRSVAQAVLGGRFRAWGDCCGIDQPLRRVVSVPRDREELGVQAISRHVEETDRSGVIEDEFWTQFDMACYNVIWLSERIAGRRGTEEQMSGHVSIVGTEIGCFCDYEPEAGSDATSIRTPAVKSDNGYDLNGTKCFITDGARSDFIIVFATTDRSRGRFGIRAFVVERGTPGLAVRWIRPWRRTRRSHLQPHLHSIMPRAA